MLLRFLIYSFLFITCHHYTSNLETNILREKQRQMSVLNRFFKSKSYLKKVLFCKIIKDVCKNIYHSVCYKELSLGEENINANIYFYYICLYFSFIDVYNYVPGTEVTDQQKYVEHGIWNHIILIINHIIKPYYSVLVKFRILFCWWIWSPSECSWEDICAIFSLEESSLQEVFILLVLIYE